MLVLTRRLGEEIVIGGDIRVTVLSVSRAQVRLGITAPRHISVDRQEIHERRCHGADEFNPGEPVAQSETDTHPPAATQCGVAAKNHRPIRA